MSSPTPTTLGPAGRIRSCAGFTLLELAIVVVIIGLISSIAIPSYQRIQRNSRYGVLMNDFRVFASAFQQYNAVNAKWPAYSSTKNAFPAGMNEYLRRTNWTQRTVFGGNYNWDYNIKHNGRKVTAAVAVYKATKFPLTMTAAEMLAFDRKFDDGNLTTGNFQKGFQNCLLYIVQN